MAVLTDRKQQRASAEAAALDRAFEQEFGHTFGHTFDAAYEQWEAAELPPELQEEQRVRQQQPLVQRTLDRLAGGTLLIMDDGGHLLASIKLSSPAGLIDGDREKFILFRPDAAAYVRQAGTPNRYRLLDPSGAVVADVLDTEAHMEVVDDRGHVNPPLRKGTIIDIERPLQFVVREVRA